MSGGLVNVLIVVLVVCMLIIFVTLRNPFQALSPRRKKTRFSRLFPLVCCFASLVSFQS